MENRELLRRYRQGDRDAGYQLARKLNTSTEILRELAESEDLQIAEEAKWHVNLAGEAEENWQAEVDAAMEAADLEQNDRLVVEMLKLGSVPEMFLSQWLPVDAGIRNLKYPDLPERYAKRLFDRLFRDPDFSKPKLQSLLKTAKLPLSIFTRFIGDLDPSIRAAVRSNPYCLQSLLEEFDRTEETAKNQNADPETLAELAKMDWFEVRKAVAENPNTSVEILDRLAFQCSLKPEESVEIALAIARNLQASETALERLSHHANAKVREAVVENPHTNKTIVERWLHESYDCISRFFPYFGGRIYITTSSGSLLIDSLSLFFTIYQSSSKAWLEVETLSEDFLHEESFRLFEELAGQYDVPKKILKGIACLVSFPKKLQRSLIRRNSNISQFFVDKIYNFIFQHASCGDRLLTLLKSDDERATTLKQIWPSWQYCISTLTPSEIDTLQWMSADLGLSKDSLDDRTLSNYPQLEHLDIFLRWEKKFSKSTEEEKVSVSFEEKIANELLKNPAFPEDLKTQLPVKPSKLFKSQESKSTGQNQLWKVHQNRDKKRILARQTRDLKKLSQLVEDSDEEIRLILVDRCSTLPLSILQKLARDASVKVRLRLINPSKPLNPEIFSVILEILAEDIAPKVREEVAKQPDTPVESLRKLSRDRNAYVRQQILRNPNTPSDVLMDFFEELLRNSETLRQQLDRDRLLRKFPPNLLAAIAKHPDCTIRYRVACHPNTSSETLTQLAKDSYLPTVRTVAKHPNTPAKVLERLSQRKDFTTRYNTLNNLNLSEAVISNLFENEGYWENQPLGEGEHTEVPVDRDRFRQAIARHPNTSIEILKTLVEEAFDPEENTEQLKAIVSNPNLTSDLLDIAIERASVEVRQAIVGHPQLTPQQWEKLAIDRDVRVREVVAMSATLPAIIDILQQDESATVRRNLVFNQHLLEPLLEQLAQDIDSSVRQAVLQQVLNSDNPPISVLAKLADAPETEIRQSIANHPNVNDTILEHLIHDDRASVRQGILDNPNLSVSLLEQLAQDIDSSVRQAVLQQVLNSDNPPISVLAKLADAPETEIRQAIANHPHANSAILAKLADAPEIEIRRSIANHPHANSAILEKLANDEKISVRQTVLDNPKTPISIQETIPEWQYRPSPLGNRTTSLTLRGAIVPFNPQTDDRSQILAQYTQSTVPFIRLMALMNPQTPVAALEEGSTSSFWLERYAVANNSATPQELRKKLAYDSHCLVRAAAKAQLSNPD
ncbi:hypothetical protein [Baaleninema simplex]|uniref:hypothetical protein n=1 Tax=Baaleninema simplex TaxID=2862350 RepID=UPI001181C122|nr:hypothetical protein [Baaleninema simplex]